MALFDRTRSDDAGRTSRPREMARAGPLTLSYDESTDEAVPNQKLVGDVADRQSDDADNRVLPDVGKSRAGELLLQGDDRDQMNEVDPVCGIGQVAAGRGVS
jgi:hypothetical protein